MRTSPTGFLHLVHPKPVPMTSIIQPIAKILDVPVVSYAEWLERLEMSLKTLSGSESDVHEVQENPAFKLIEFYRSIGDDANSPEAYTRTRLSVEKTIQVCATLGDGNLHTLDERDAQRWLVYWEEKGVIQLN